MKELERQVMCVLLQRLLDKSLIPEDLHSKSWEKILDIWDGPDFFCRCEDGKKEESHGYTQNPC